MNTYKHQRIVLDKTLNLGLKPDTLINHWHRAVIKLYRISTPEEVRKLTPEYIEDMTKDLCAQDKICIINTAFKIMELDAHQGTIH